MSSQIPITSYQILNPKKTNSKFFFVSSHDAMQQKRVHIYFSTFQRLTSGMSIALEFPHSPDFIKIFANNVTLLLFLFRKCLNVHSVRTNCCLNVHSVCTNLCLNVRSIIYYICLLNMGKVCTNQFSMLKCTQCHIWLS